MGDFTQKLKKYNDRVLQIFFFFLPTLISQIGEKISASGHLNYIGIIDHKQVFNLFLRILYINK